MGMGRTEEDRRGTNGAMTCPRLPAKSVAEPGVETKSLVAAETQYIYLRVDVEQTQHTTVQVTPLQGSYP